MRFTLPLLLLMLPLTACEKESSAADASQTCNDLCDELVTNCEYGAYPRYDSCLQGCSWYEEQGADVLGELHCIQDAACDTFLIVECEHEYGMVEE
jgi:hypothetical protein